MAVWLSPFEYLKQIIGGMYMESGFAQYLNIAPCNEDTFKPSLIHFNTEVAAYMSGTNPLQGNCQTDPATPFFLGESKTTGFESYATGCNDKVNSIVRCSVTYTQGSPTYCDTDEIRRRKNIQQKIKPSVFTGKLQLFVQALYGSTRNDYETDESYTLLDYPLTVNSIRIGYRTTPHSSGLLTSTTGYKYYLINISSSVKARELVPNSDGELFRTHLIANAGSMDAATIKKVEALILSTCTVSATEQSVSVDLSSLVGTPIDYGWHFNYAGSEAHIILHRDNLPTDQFFHAYHYKLEFTESAGVISATLTTVTSDQTWYAIDKSIIFKPGYVTGNMEALVNPKQTPFSGWVTDSTWGADIYCFYDATDTLRLCTISNTYTAAVAVGLNNPQYCGIQTGTKFISIGAHTEGAKNAKTIKIDTVTLSATNYVDPAAYARTIRVFGAVTSPDAFPPTGAGPFGGWITPAAADGTTNELCGNVGIYNFVTGNGWVIAPSTGNPTGRTITIGSNTYSIRMRCFITRHTGVNDYQIVRKDTSVVKQVLIVPFNNANTAFIGQRHRFNEDETTRSHQWTNGLVNAQIYFKEYYIDGSNNIHILNDFGPYDMEANRIFNQISGSGTISPVDADNTNVDFKTLTETMMTETSTSTTFRDNYFVVDYLTDPFGYFYANSQKSTGAAYRHEIDSGYGLVNNDWLHDTSIGWS